MYVLNIKLKEAAASEFEKITEDNVGKKIAMIINNEVILNAVIRDPITSGMITVSGETEEKIKELGIALQKEIGNRYK